MERCDMPDQAAWVRNVRHESPVWEKTKTALMALWVVFGVYMPSTSFFWHLLLPPERLLLLVSLFLISDMAVGVVMASQSKFWTHYSFWVSLTVFFLEPLGYVSRVLGSLVTTDPSRWR